MKRSHSGKRLPEQQTRNQGEVILAEQLRVLGAEAAVIAESPPHEAAREGLVDTAAADHRARNSSRRRRSKTRRAASASTITVSVVFCVSINFFNRNNLGHHGTKRL